MARQETYVQHQGVFGASDYNYQSFSFVFQAVSDTSATDIHDAGDGAQVSKDRTVMERRVRQEVKVNAGEDFGKPRSLSGKVEEGATIGNAVRLSGGTPKSDRAK
ncbi:hypothetical protein RvY_03028 [Ramazzottius varieornatus]|uniref:Uncharacterized protein n=1 Tax=Ramazzottius varieornatus TaxID=947166 RepID=A0A1D1ULN0_RAMVA|nr:hypothetical protein RvY_03028 [Ramazzottius varieornatus]